MALCLLALSPVACASGRAAAPARTALAAARSVEEPAPSPTPAPPAIPRETAPGCVETAVRDACGPEPVRRLYLLRDRWAECEVDLAVGRIRREGERETAARVLGVERALAAEREATCRRELAECRDLARPRGTPWWAWPAVVVGGAIAGAAAWEAVR